MQRLGKSKLTPEQAFAKILRQVRRQRGLSQEVLGFEAGYHRTYIGMLERGLMNPSLRTILSLATALDIAPGEFVERVNGCLGGTWKRERESRKEK